MGFLYVFSISFQVAGAILLMTKVFLGSRRENAIKRVFGHKLVELDNNTNEIIYEEKVFKDAIKEEYLTILSIIYILIGYAIGIFGSIEKANKSLILFGISLVTFLLIKIANLFADYLYKKFPQINKKVTIKELKKYGINMDIQSLSFEDIDKIIQKAELNMPSEK